MEKNSSNKKTNRKLKKNTIKRPQTPYFLFCTDIRNQLKKSKKKIKYTAKQLGQLWKNLTEDKKNYYKEMYQTNYKIYKEKIKKRKNSTSPSHTISEEDSDNPKKSTENVKSESYRKKNIQNRKPK